MARAIYEVKLKERYFPAHSEAEALEMQNESDCGLKADEASVSLAVKEEHAVKLFLLAKTMYDTEKFDYNEVEVAVQALARELGYFTNYTEISGCIISWTERFCDIPMDEFVDWIL